MAFFTFAEAKVLAPPFVSWNHMVNLFQLQRLNLRDILYHCPKTNAQTLAGTFQISCGEKGQGQDQETTKPNKATSCFVGEPNKTAFYTTTSLFQPSRLAFCQA